MRKVSILIPCYNSSAFLAETIRSAFDQTWENKEIIVVNDGSTDNSGEIAENFRSEIVKVYHQANGGACRARNLAFEMSSGDYIQYLDADDLLPADKIEKQLRLSEGAGDNYIISSPWSKFVDKADDSSDNHSILYRDYADPVQMLIDMWYTQEMMQTSVWLTPRGIIEKAGKWDETLTVNQDGEFFCRVLLASAGVKFCSETRSFYRAEVKGSVSNAAASKTKAASLLKSFLSYETEINRQVDNSRVREALAANYYTFIYLYYHLYPDLVQVAVERVKGWNMPPPSIGGKNFKRLAGVLGFFNTLQMRRIIYKYTH